MNVIIPNISLTNSETLDPISLNPYALTLDRKRSVLEAAEARSATGAENGALGALSALGGEERLAAPWFQGLAAEAFVAEALAARRGSRSRGRTRGSSSRRRRSS